MTQLFKLFRQVFTRNTNESDINPRAYKGKDFILTTKVFLALLEYNKIDFWKAVHIQPSWYKQLHPDKCEYSDEPMWQVGDVIYTRGWSLLQNQKYYEEAVERYDGNPTYENIFYSKQKDYEGKKYWTVEHIAEGNEMRYEILCDLQVEYFNKMYSTSFTTDDWQNDKTDGTIWDSGENDTGHYFCLMSYLINWIDRFAHEYIENKLIPESEKTNVTFYDGIPYYDFENDLYIRNNCKNFSREKITCIEDIPENLQACWKFFKMCEPCLKQFYPKDIYIEEEKENYEFLEAVSQGGCGGINSDFNY